MVKSNFIVAEKRKSARKIIVKVISSLSVGTISAIAFGYLVNTMMDSILNKNY